MNTTTNQRDPLAVGIEDARFFLRTQARTLQPAISAQFESLIANPPSAPAIFFARLTKLQQAHWQTVPVAPRVTNEDCAADYAAHAMERWAAGEDGAPAWRNAVYYARQAGAWVSIPETSEDAASVDEPQASERVEVTG